MGWPQATDYNAAVQNPHVCFRDADLRRSRPVTDPFGLPRPHGGNFADVYQLQGPDGQAWAVKCFTHEVHGLHARYQAVSDGLRRRPLPFMVDFRYLDEGICLRNQWYPVLKMRWIEGLRLNEFVAEHLDRPVVLERLAALIVKLGQELRDAGIAHGDLQHGNILLIPGTRTSSLSLRLIDYDGLHVPALAQQPSGKVGHPHYQHPQRLRDGHYDADMDRFSLLLLGTALRALGVGGKELWQRYDNGENLLFREDDFRNPAGSELLAELWSSGNAAVKALAGHLLLSSQRPIDQVPCLDVLLDGDTVRALTIAEAEQVHALLGLPAPAGPAPSWWEAAPLVEPVLTPVPEVAAPITETATPQVVVLDAWGPFPAAPVTPEPVPEPTPQTVVLDSWGPFPNADEVREKDARNEGPKGLPPTPVPSAAVVAPVAPPGRPSWVRLAVAIGVVLLCLLLLGLVLAWLLWYLEPNNQVPG